MKEAARVRNTGRVRGACHLHPSAHGSPSRAVQERKRSTRVFNTGRVREACHFHPSAHGACCSTQTVLFVWIARVSEGFSTGRVRDFGNTGHAD